MKSVEEQINELYGDKRPYCKVCDKDAVLAEIEDVEMYKKIVDINYPLDFIYIPDCECWLDEPDWMEVR